MPRYTADQFRGHLNIAERFLEAAEILLQSDHRESAVSRAYYALFTATVALVAVKAGRFRARWDHSELQKAFLDSFTKKGFLFGKNDADDYAEVLRARLDVDYHLYPLTQGKARDLVTRVRRLLERIVKELGTNA